MIVVVTYFLQICFQGKNIINANHTHDHLSNSPAPTKTKLCMDKLGIVTIRSHWMAHIDCLIFYF
jgi:hypothetical protein